VYPHAAQQLEKEKKKEGKNVKICGLLRLNKVWLYHLVITHYSRHFFLKAFSRSEFHGYL
jgi:hypothetical protein